MTRRQRLQSILFCLVLYILMCVVSFWWLGEEVGLRVMVYCTVASIIATVGFNVIVALFSKVIKGTKQSET